MGIRFTARHHIDAKEVPVDEKDVSRVKTCNKARLAYAESEGGLSVAGHDRGFSLMEMVTVVAIIFIIAAIGVPQLINAIRMSEVRSAAAGVASLVQQARIMAERQNATIPVYTAAVGESSLPGAFISCSSTNCPDGTSWQSGDTSYVAYQSGVTNSASGAPTGPNPGFTPETTGTILYFNSLGLAVKNDGTSSKGVIYYFTDPTNDWAAVSVSPVGRTKLWVWDGATWQ